MTLSLPAAELFATFLSSTLYGIYIVTLGIAGRVLLNRWKHRSSLNWVVVCVCAILFVNVSLDHSLAIALDVDAFVTYTGLGSAQHVFAHASSWQTFTKTLCVGIQSLTGDAILIYRCWFIWRKSLVVIALPLLLWLANLAGAIGLLFTMSRSTLVSSNKLVPWGQTVWALTLCNNIFITSLIVWRIRGVQKESKQLRSSRDPADDEPESPFGRVMRNIIESGMIYTTCAILMFAAFTTQSTLTYPASALEMHSVGIMFNLIIIRGARRPPLDSMVVTGPLQFAHTITTSGDIPGTNVGGEEKTEVFGRSRIQHDPDDAASMTV
ncbi:hypothetical protein B0H17DRAFT_251722 [Mycena rosella]|uniref:Uncharacterized protein n=1 Tax=Mycena rosella TaxID=1033263 RepID=A0AAD7DXM1_MYCRO|nr:hypothetical protein B0H17DRAFT_251722 [Mycena rosella]